LETSFRRCFDKISGSRLWYLSTPSRSFTCTLDSYPFPASLGATDPPTSGRQSPSLVLFLLQTIILLLLRGSQTAWQNQGLISTELWISSTQHGNSKPQQMFGSDIFLLQRSTSKNAVLLCNWAKFDFISSVANFLNYLFISHQIQRLCKVKR
jgi:hypothetical protein